MKGHHKIFVRFDASFKCHVEDILEFSKNYESLIDKHLGQFTFNFRRGLCYKLNSMMAYMNDFKLCAFLLFLNENEYNAFNDFIQDIKGSYKSLIVKEIHTNKDHNYELMSQLFYDKVFKNFITKLKTLDENDFTQLLRCTMDNDFHTLLTSGKINYNKRAFRKLSTNYSVISKWRQKCDLKN